MELIINGESVQVDLVSKETPLREYIKTKVSAPGREDDDDPFFVVDLGRLIKLHRDWVAALPNITPFYAVKCNVDPVLLRTLAALGTGFDCASKAELTTVLDLGVAPDRIIYANPCKQISHLKYAASRGVDLLVFDSECELHKIKELYPSARLVLRILSDDPNAVTPFGNKFGCSVTDGKLLLNTGKSLELNVVGICFHVGYGAQSPSAYEDAIKKAAEMFAHGSQIGYHFGLLDFGGGFPGETTSKELFHRMADAINGTLKTYFNPEAYPGLRVIGEPGTYFARSTHTIAINIICKRIHKEKEGQQYTYYFNDGAYGSFAIIYFHKSIPPTSVLKDVDGPLYRCSLWGPTCDSTDALGVKLLPELEVGDWLYVRDMGAYSSACSTDFNGFPRTKSYYYITSENQDEFQKLLLNTSSDVSHFP